VRSCLNLITPALAMETHQIPRLYHSNLAVTPKTPESSIHINYQNSQVLSEIQNFFPKYSFVFNLDVFGLKSNDFFTEHKNRLAKCNQYLYFFVSLFLRK
jgi:hypothetical protein